ncbi:unnamed protein product, partial [Ectocarpus fasciculatus]
LIVTLKRLIRRLRRRCGKLQELLRWEAKFRWHYGKPPPELAVCTTRSTRKTLTSEQQELRVVLAHLRAISFDTVKAVCDWRTTFLVSGKPGYRHVHPSGSAPGLPNERTRFPGSRFPGSPAKSHEHFHDIGIVCREDQEGHHEGNNQRNSQREQPWFIDASPEEHQVGHKRRGSEAGSGHHHDPHDLHDEDDDNAVARSITVPRHVIGKNDSSPAPVFLWKGHNYLTKLAHDLEFLDDSNASAPVSAWLGFSVRDNPFLIPPNGLDVCEDLRRQREERREEAAVRRRQQLQHQRSGGTGNGQRRLSRSRSRSRANSSSSSSSSSSSDNDSHDHGDDDNHRRASASGDVSAPPPRRQSKQERKQGRDPDNDIKGRGARPEPMMLTPQQQSAPPIADEDANYEGRKRKSGSATENVVTNSPLLLVTDDQNDGVDGGGGIFVTEGVVRSALSTTAAGEGSLRSASTSVESPLFPPGLGYSDDENTTIPHQLSADEEEELQWMGGGRLDLPIVPELHESVRSKALAAAQVLRGETASEQALTSSARAILSNTRRTEGILHTPEKDCSVRVESLAERSVREGLRGALVDRHVGATRLKLAPSLLKSSSCVMMGTSPCWREEKEGPPLVRSVSTAPARGGGRPGLTVICSGAAAARGRAGAARLGHGRALAAFGSSGGGGGSSRGGVRVSVDGHHETTGGAKARAGNRSGDPSRCTQSVPRDGNIANNRDEKGKRAPLSSSRSQCPQSGTGSKTPTAGLGATKERNADTTAVSAASPGDRSTTSSSLQASSSTMSARARARALAVRPTATRRPFCRNGGGRVIIPDPGVSADVRRRAAARIQAALLALCARRYVRGLRDDRERAARLICRNWRRWRARADMRAARRLRRAEGLRRVVEDRSRNRAAHVIQTFFRDVRYRRERDRHEMSLRGDPGALASQLREENAAIAVQVHVRRLIASKRVRGVRHTRRAQAQACIALAVRQRAARVRQKEREQREEQKERERTGGGDQDIAYYLEMATMRTKPLSLQPDEAATRIQAWRRGVHYRRVAGVAAAQVARREETPTAMTPKEPPHRNQGSSKSAHLRAALEALQAAHSAVALSKKSTANDERRRHASSQDVVRKTAEERIPRQVCIYGRPHSIVGRNGAKDTAAVVPVDGLSSSSESPRVDELRRLEARVSERRNTPSSPARVRRANPSRER